MEENKNIEELSFDEAKEKGYITDYDNEDDLFEDLMEKGYIA